MVYLFREGSWLTIKKVISSFSSLIIGIAYANLLTQESYGLYKYLLSLLGIISILTMPGINTALTISISKNHKESIKKIIFSKFKWSLLSSLVCVTFSFYYFLNDNIELVHIFLLFSIFLPLNMSFVHGAILEGNKDFKSISVYSSISQIIITITLIIYLLNFKSIFMLILIQQSLALFLNIIFFSIISKKFNNHKGSTYNTVPYGIHLTLTNTIGIIATHIDKILILRFLSPSQLSIYIFALLPAEQITTVLSSLTKVAFPKIANQSINNIKNTLLQKIVKFYIILIPVTIFIILLIPTIYEIIFPNYTDSIIYAQAYAFIIILFPQRLLGTVFVTQNKKKQLYISKIVTPIIKIILFFILIPLFGINGAIITLILSKLINGVIMLTLFKKL